MLKGKNIVIGVSGGVAVYKVVDVVSRLRKLCANINVIMTKSATEFVQPLTFQSLSQNYVITDMFDEPKTWDVEHISLAQKADMFLIAPATANIIGKIANGIADDMLSTTVMATTAPVIIAPAMNTNMYNNPITQKNINFLKSLGYKFIDPASGRLACGDYGKGKLADPEDIVKEVVSLLLSNESSDELSGKTVLVTAGPTKEPIDPVRYITNHSTGKMGYAIAREAKKRGANVILVSGPTNLDTPIGVKRIDVSTSNEMYEAVKKNFESADIIIKSAAVADYRPKTVAHSKIKKSDNDMSIELTRNTDILYEIGQIKKNKILIGFAAETNNVIANAKAKIKKKNLDFIVANDITEEGAGFKGDTNVISIIDSQENVQKYDILTKDEVANIILDKVNDIIINRNIKE